MKKSMMTGLVFLVSSLATTFSSNAFASGSDIDSFLASLKGHWSGQGTLSELQNNGEVEDTRYDIDVEVSEEVFDKKFDFHSSIRTEHHITRIDDMSYKVVGENLFVSTNSQTQPVNVVESTPVKLVYTIQRAEFFTGRVFDFQFTYEYSAFKRLKGYTEIRVNKVLFSTDEYELRKH